jgi:hypothetical protein
MSWYEWILSPLNGTLHTRKRGNINKVIQHKPVTAKTRQYFKVQAPASKGTSRLVKGLRDPPPAEPHRTICHLCLSPPPPPPYTPRMSTHALTRLTPCDTHFSSIVHKQAPWPTHTTHTRTHAHAGAWIEPAHSPPTRDMRQHHAV